MRRQSTTQLRSTSYWTTLPEYSNSSRGADIAFELPPEQIELVEESDGIDVDYAVEPIIIYGGINRYLEPTNDRDLRHALNYAVSQSDLIDSVFQGSANRQISDRASNPVERN